MDLDTFIIFLILFGIPFFFIAIGSSSNKRHIPDSEIRRKKREREKEYEAIDEREKLISKEKRKLYKEQKYWLKVVDTRVKSMPNIEHNMNFSQLADAHFEEYCNRNNKGVSSKKLKEEAIDRVLGFSSITGFINNYGTEKQKFHQRASYRGAVLYARHLKINDEEWGLNVLAERMKNMT